MIRELKVSINLNRSNGECYRARNKRDLIGEYLGFNEDFMIKKEKLGRLEFRSIGDSKESTRSFE